jgi:cell division protein FtsL
MTPDSPGDQIKFIEGNVIHYVGILFNTTFIIKGYSYLEGIIGNLGWEDTPFPLFFIISFLILLFVNAFGTATSTIKSDWKRTLILFLFFIIGYGMILSGFYVYMTPLKGFYVEGVQGRYFIPFAPLFFILFYNLYINEKLNLAFSLRKDELRKLKVKDRPGLIMDILRDEKIFTRFLHVIIVCFTVFSLLFTVYLIAHRYYFIGDSTDSANARINAEKTARMKYQVVLQNEKIENHLIDLANAASKAGKFDSMTYYLEKVIDLDPTVGNVAQNLAGVYFQKKEKDKALKVLDKMKAHGMEIPTDLQRLAK